MVRRGDRGFEYDPVHVAVEVLHGAFPAYVLRRDSRHGKQGRYGQQKGTKQIVHSRIAYNLCKYNGFLRINCYIRTMIRLSLIIPTHNRAGQLLAALESVVRQDMPAGEWECVVVNNNSTDDTPARFAAFAARYPALNLRMVTETGPGVSYARNRGIAETSAPYMAFIDDDERINAGFIRAYVEFFDAHPDAVVAGGRIIAEYVSGTSGVDVEIYRTACRQPDGFRPCRTAFSCRTCSRGRQHGFPPFRNRPIRRVRPPRWGVWDGC